MQAQSVRNIDKIKPEPSALARLTVASFKFCIQSRIGTQVHGGHSCTDYVLPMKETLLPSYLKKCGFSTHMVGKWHLGYARTEYLPQNRGFDTFYGK